MLTSEQIDRAVEVMQEYLNAPSNPDDGQTPLEVQKERDKRREELIEQTLSPLLNSYFDDEVPLVEFKRQVDSINKQNGFWGFRGIKGQMFFNILVNVSEDEKECVSELKAALKVPESEDISSSRLKTFASYVKRVGEHHVEMGGDKRGQPKLGSIPFFLSYFWQIQDRDHWPVYYTNSVNTLNDLNLWRPSGELAEDYLSYKHIHEELVSIFSTKSGEDFSLYDVEHVFWFKGGNPYGGNRPLPMTSSPTEESVSSSVSSDTAVVLLPDSYIPPIVSILPRMALNEPQLQEAARASGTSLERGFEKSINAAFTILDFETKLLGQGQGRVPDGLALALDEQYGIIWDAKVRSDTYNMGTDDRTIKEYVTTQSRDLKRRRTLRNIYYFIISSSFADDFDDLVRSLKMDTDVSEVCLVEAEAIVAMTDQKLRAPQQFSLGPDGLQRLFSVSGIISAETVQENLI